MEPTSPPSEVAVPRPSSSPAAKRIGRVDAIVLGLILVVLVPYLCVLLVVLPLTLVLPSFWLAVGVAALLLGGVLWLAARLLPQ